MTQEQKLELGIEIVSAMKASAYGLSIESGRDYALSDTEVDRMSFFSFEEFKEFDPSDQQKYISYCANQKKELHKQALFVAEITLEKIKTMNL